MFKGVMCFLLVLLGELAGQAAPSEPSAEIKKTGQVPEQLVIEIPPVLATERPVYVGAIGDVNTDGWNDFAVSGTVAGKNGPLKVDIAFLMSGADGKMLSNAFVLDRGCAKFVLNAGEIAPYGRDGVFGFYKCHAIPSVLATKETPVTEWGVDLFGGRSFGALATAGCFSALTDATLYLAGGDKEGVTTFYFVKVDESVVALQYDPQNPDNRRTPGQVAVVSEDGPPLDQLIVNGKLAVEAEYNVAQGKVGVLGRRSDPTMVEWKPGTELVVATSRSAYPDTVTKPKQSEPKSEVPKSEVPPAKPK